MTVYLAPLEGVTDATFRRVHHQCFSGVEKYFIPFVSPTQNLCFTARELNAISPEVNEGVPAIPQLLVKDAEQFLWAAGELKSMGYPEVNLNLGCPSGTVTAKGKGSGLLREKEALERFLDEIFARAPLPISVKTRIGYASAQEWPELLALLAKYPVHELIIHPRTREDFYKGPLHMETWQAAKALLRCPLVYNGDLFSAGDCREFAEREGDFPVMAGRGLIANPAMAQALTGGENATPAALKNFCDCLQEAYLRRYPANVAHSRIREVLKYISCCFEGAEKIRKAIRKSRNLAECQDAAERLFACPLAEDPGYLAFTWVG